MEQISHYMEAATEVAKSAGVVICEALKQEKQIDTKTCAADLVTETDQKVEKMIMSSLKSKFPSHSFIGEESVAAGEPCDLTDNPTWIIDPIDGTTDFIHRFPYSCVSIGLAINKKLELGLVYNPNLDDMYTAIRGQGAYLNGKKIQVSNVDEIGQSLILSEFGSNRDADKLEKKFQGLKNVLIASHGIRSLGSCAMAMCLVAAGNGDAYFEFGIHCWDMAAGYVIVTEAGGTVIDPSGKPFDLMSRRLICASTEKLAQQLCGLVVPVEFKRD